MACTLLLLQCNFFCAHRLNADRFNNDDIKKEFTEFITALANVTFVNMNEVLPLNNSFNVPSDEYLNLLWNLSFTFRPEVSSGTGNKLFLQSTITEMGLCYSVNSNMAIYNSYE